MLYNIFNFFANSVLAAGELTILNHPKGITFKGHERLDQSLLKDVYSAALGFSINRVSYLSKYSLKQFIFNK